MHTTTSALTLLLAGSSAVADAVAPKRRSLATADHARSLGMKAIHRSLAIARKTQGEDPDLMAIFGGDEGGGLGAVFCPALELAAGMGMMDMSELEDMEGVEGMEDAPTDMDIVCSTMACDAARENIVMDCSMSPDSDGGDICVDYDGDDYCITDPTISIIVGLDLTNSDFVVEQCGTYTEPPLMAALGKGCAKIHLNMDLGSLMGDMMGDGGEMTEEEAAALAADAIQIQECSVNFEGDPDDQNDDTACECTICHEGMGFELICDEGLNTFTQECIDYDASATSALGGGAPNDEVSFSVMRLVQIPADGTVISDIPADPAVADPADPAVADPADPTVADPADPAVDDPADPSVADPADPAVADPADPTAADPADPAVADPADTTDADPAGAGTLDSPAAYHTGALGAGLVILSASLFTMM